MPKGKCRLGVGEEVEDEEPFPQCTVLLKFGGLTNTKQ
jgi:hypothetical protein